jgi:hypothetical protein
LYFFRNALQVRKRILTENTSSYTLSVNFKTETMQLTATLPNMILMIQKITSTETSEKEKGIYTKLLGVTIREAKDSCAGMYKNWDNFLSDSLLLNMRPLYTADIVENRKLIFNSGTDFNWKRIVG